MIKLGELSFYASWVKDLHGHIVRVSGPNLSGKQGMVVALVPKEDMVILLGGLCSFLEDETENSLTRPLNDQFGTEIDITRYPRNVVRSDRIYRVLVKSGQLIVRSDITQDQLETLAANMKVLVHRDIE